MNMLSSVASVATLGNNNMASQQPYLNNSPRSNSSTRRRKSRSRQGSLEGPASNGTPSPDLAIRVTF
jgi:hypothetical protein